MAAQQTARESFHTSINPISRLISRPELARSLRHKTVRVLQLWEQKGYGPPVVRLGGRAYYDPQALEAWIRSSEVKPGVRPCRQPLDSDSSARPKVSRQHTTSGHSNQAVPRKRAR